MPDRTGRYLWRPSPDADWDVVKVGNISTAPDPAKNPVLVVYLPAGEVPVAETGGEWGEMLTREQAVEHRRAKEKKRERMEIEAADVGDLGAVLGPPTSPGRPA